MPRTGTSAPPARERAARRAGRAGSWPASSAGDHPGQRPLGRRRARRRAWRAARPTRSTSQAATIVLIIPARPSALAVLGREDAGDAVVLQLGDLVGDDDAAAAAVDLHVARAPRPAGGRRGTEVLDVAALVGGRRRRPARPPGRTAVTTSSTERLWPRWMTSAPWDCRMRRMMLIDGVVPVEQAGGGDEPDRVRRACSRTARPCRTE